MVYLKSGAEIKKMQSAGRILVTVFASLQEMIRPGITTMDLDKEAERIIRMEGATPSFYLYGTPPFPASICASVNSEVVHGIPRADRVLCEGDIISVDLGAKLDGYHADAARTFAVGKISEDAARLIRVTEECFQKGLEKVQIGNRIGDISHAVEVHAKQAGCSVVRELVGHGIGRELHEEPSVPNYGSPGKGMRIASGLCICIEPMINLGERFVTLSSDQWTIVAADGKPSAHYENTIAVTPDGPIITTI